MKYCNLFCTIRLESNKNLKEQQKLNVSLVMIRGNSSTLTPCFCFWPIFTDFQNEVFSLNLNISAKYQPS